MLQTGGILPEQIKKILRYLYNFIVRYNLFKVKRFDMLRLRFSLPPVILLAKCKGAHPPAPERIFMKYDFTSIMDRRGRDALAVDAVGKMNGFAPSAPDPGFDVIPMWVADMNFPALPAITKAITDRVSHPAFGYFLRTPPCE